MGRICSARVATRFQKRQAPRSRLGSTWRCGGRPRTTVSPRAECRGAVCGRACAPASTRGTRASIPRGKRVADLGSVPPERSPLKRLLDRQRLDEPPRVRRDVYELGEHLRGEHERLAAVEHLAAERLMCPRVPRMFQEIEFDQERGVSPDHPASPRAGRRSRMPGDRPGRRPRPACGRGGWVGPSAERRPD